MFAAKGDENMAKKRANGEGSICKRSDGCWEGRYTVGEWVALWFEIYAKPNIRERTADYYNRYITKHIVPCLGDIKLNKLTGRQIQKMYNDLLDHGRERVSQKKSRSVRHICSRHSRDAA